MIWSRLKVVSILVLALLFTPFFTHGQNRIENIVEFTKLTHDFGDFSIKSGMKTTSFTFKNISNNPIVIHSVISSCGCTNPEWTKRPIKPGESGEIEVAFLNDQGPYPFNKALTVYISGLKRPVVLRIKGVVHETELTTAQIYSYKIGDLSFRDSYVQLGSVAKSNSLKESVYVANTTTRPLNVAFTDLPEGLKLTASPTRLEPGRRGEIIIEYDTENVKSWGVTSLSATLVINGEKITEPKLEMETHILDNFSSLSAQELERAPIPALENNVYNFGTIKSGTKINKTFTIRNNGLSTLILHKYNSNAERIAVSHPKKIESGKRGKAVVAIVVTEPPGKVIYNITFVTNSPEMPVFNLLLAGTVTK